MTTKKTLRIALFADDFYPASGGITRSIQTQVNEFVCLGHSVTLLVPEHSLERPANCTTVALPAFYIAGTPSHMCIVKHTEKIARAIAAEHTFDVVHSQTERGALMLAAHIARMQHIPHIHTFHANLAGTHKDQPFASFWGSMAYLFLVNPAITRITPRRTAQAARALPQTVDTNDLFARLDWGSLATIATHVDAFTTPSSFMMRYIQAGLPDDSPLHAVIPNGYNRSLGTTIAVNGRTRSSRGVRFISIGRISPEKRIKELVQAFILANIPESELVIIGDGGQYEQIRKLAKDHSNIHFRGHISCQETIAQELRDADIFALTSYHFDNQPMVITEAIVAGLPILYCDERLDAGVTPQNSILTASPSVADIADSMKVIADPAVRKPLAQQSQEVAKQLAPDTMANAYLKLYREAIQILSDDKNNQL